MDIRLFENVMETISRNQGWVKENGIKELQAAKGITWPTPSMLPISQLPEQPRRPQEVRWKEYFPD